MLEKVVNLNEFLGVLAFDKMGNADARRSIFFRASLREFASAYPVHPAKLGFIAHMMNHCYFFDGPHWNFPDSPIPRLYFLPARWIGTSKASTTFNPGSIASCTSPKEIIDDALKSVSAAWLNGDQPELESIREASKARINPFPNWTSV